MTPSRVILAVVYAGTTSTLAHAQASLDYAARSVGSALASGPGEMYLGACPMNGSVIDCIHQYYPTLFNFSLWASFSPQRFYSSPRTSFELLVRRRCVRAAGQLNDRGDLISPFPVFSGRELLN